MRKGLRTRWPSRRIFFFFKRADALRVREKGKNSPRGSCPRGTVERLHAQVANVQVFSSLVEAMTSRSSSDPGRVHWTKKMSHWFLILSGGSAVMAYISCINWWSEARK